MTVVGRQHSGESQLYWVADNVIRSDFPDVRTALRDPDGLLAIGGDLSPERLLDAYRRGIFPWYSKGQPILWWSPNPRYVIEPKDFHVSRSLRKTLRRKPFRVTFNRAFDQVVAGCAAPRAISPGTWITPEMNRAYCRLHELGHALSVECWQGKRVAGGLFGVVIGRIFFGESMFSRAADASKIALSHLVHEAAARGFRLIDCQMHSRHLQRMGAYPMPRDLFTNILKQCCSVESPRDWPVESPPPS
ncbi:MAG: leucyl/phenylalanyl-tRNA--protein transferase [Gammaproteobacteria bacterium]